MSGDALMNSCPPWLVGLAGADRTMLVSQG